MIELEISSSEIQRSCHGISNECWERSAEFMTDEATFDGHGSCEGSP